MNALRSQLSWTHYRCILTISDESKRNYYINLSIKNNLSSRELDKEIKLDSYERLVNKPNKVDLIEPVKKFNLFSDIKNPIVIEKLDNKNIKTESDLEMAIVSSLKLFFRQLGDGYAFIDNQYKIVYDNRNYFIDILLFNYKFNAFVVVELKLRQLRREDKAQVEFYMGLVDKTLREPTHNQTMGIVISKSQDNIVASFVRNSRIISLTYELL